MVVKMDELSMKLVGLSKDCIVPITAVLVVTDASNLSGPQPSIESFALFVAVVIFGTFAIDVVRVGSTETIESQSVRAL